MPHEVTTAVYSGPLDLLLQLVARHQVDVTDISLAGIVEDYLALCQSAAEVDAEGLSEFVLVVATLMQLKAGVLLPEENETELDEELLALEERDRLLSRLLACVTFKDVGAVLGYRLQEHNRYVPRRRGIDRPLEVALTRDRFPFSAEQLGRSAERVLSGHGREPDVDHLDLELPSVDDAIVDLRRRVRAESEASFNEIVAHCTSAVEVVAYFLALLELARWGAVKVSQANPTDDISVEAGNEAVPESLTSEWSRQ